MGIIEAIALAFLGGMILNLMPCVLPVLAIKITSLVSMGEDSTGKRLRHGLGYTAGIVASMLTLALAVIALQALGNTVGWGFQFQHPLFVVFLAAVMVLFALNLFGVFQIGVPPGASKLDAATNSGQRRSFFEGILAVILATPCTAPFMGTAIGFAMTSHPLAIVSVFVSLGLGLAAPFVAVALVPGFQRLLPRPGPWMGTMKSVLGFALLLTALWLVWLFGRIAGPDAVIGLLGLLIALGFAAWLYGQVQYRSWDKLKAFSFAMSLVSLGAGWTVLETFSTDSDSAPAPVVASNLEAAPPTLDDDGEFNWHPWSPELIDVGLSEERPVFVNFTADWCITCKANEREIISTPRVITAADAADVVMVQADLTDMDDLLVQEMERHGRSGVPLYLYYTPDEPDDPTVLPQVITRNMLIETFGAASP